MKYDVVGIGNAIADVLCNVDEAKIKEHNITKGVMTLINKEQAKKLYLELDADKEMSGGGCANVIAGLASFGAKTAFIGKVGNDQLGEIYKHDLISLGVDYICEDSKSSDDTGMSFIMITPDAQRTMSTYLGIAPFIEPIDINKYVIQSSKIVYIEGYLWDKEITKKAIQHAFDCAKQAKKKIAFNLSDIFCAERHRDEFLRILKNDIDIVFCNEKEAQSLFQIEDLSTIYQELKSLCELSIVTRSAKGSVIITKDEIIEVEAYPCENVVDTTGAGDLYVAGFLFAYLNEYSLAECGKLASMAASEVISHIGARPLIQLKDMINEL